MYLARKEYGKKPFKPMQIDTDIDPKHLPYIWPWEPRNGEGAIRTNICGPGVSVIAMTASEALHLVSGL